MEPFLGEIRMFAGKWAPLGWSFCDGSLLPVAVNQELFGLIGTTYGGDGVATFALPDLRGRVPVGAGDAPSLSARSLGEVGGAEAVALTPQQVPPHGHTLNGTTAPADRASPVGAMLATTDPTVRPYNDASLNSGTYASFNPRAVQLLPPSQPHENRMPGTGVHYIIALEGIHPAA